MTREQYLGYFQELREKYPGVQEIRIDYNGNGDSFDEYHSPIIDGEYKSDFNIDEVEELLNEALEHSEADFNNDGSTGTITLNLLEETIDVDNYFYETVSHPSGMITVDVNVIDGITDVSGRETMEDDQLIK